MNAPIKRAQQTIRRQFYRSSTLTAAAGFLVPRTNDMLVNVFTVYGYGDSESLGLTVDLDGNQGTVQSHTPTQVSAGLWKVDIDIPEPNPSGNFEVLTLTCFNNQGTTMDQIYPFYVANVGQNPPIKIGHQVQAGAGGTKNVVINNGATESYIAGSVVIATLTDPTGTATSSTVNVTQNGFAGQWAHTFTGVNPGYYTLTADYLIYPTMNIYGPGSSELADAN